MRTRKEIEEEIKVNQVSPLSQRESIVELLLDIRDLLQNPVDLTDNQIKELFKPLTDARSTTEI